MYIILPKLLDPRLYRSIPWHSIRSISVVGLPLVQTHLSKLQKDLFLNWWKLWWSHTMIVKLSYIILIFLTLSCFVMLSPPLWGVVLNVCFYPWQIVWWYFLVACYSTLEDKMSINLLTHDMKSSDIFWYLVLLEFQFGAPLNAIRHKQYFKFISYARYP